MGKLYQTFNNLLAFTSLHRTYCFTLPTFIAKCQWVCGQKYPKTSSFLWIFLCRNSSLTKTTDSCFFLLKNISLLLISITLHYLSTILSCISAVGEETREPETRCCFRWKLYCYSLPCQLTPESFVSSSAFCLSFVFFHFRLLAYWDHYWTFARFDSLKNTSQVTVSNNHMNHLFWAKGNLVHHCINP